MSKSKKALAVLGVVAGLGVAALPLSSYAAPINDGGTGDLAPATGSVADSLKVKTTIEDTLSIEIVGNDDSHTVDTAETASHVVLLSAGGNTTIDGLLTNGSTATGIAKVTVATNNAKGYNLYLKGATAELVGNTSTNTIPAVGATPVMDGTTSEWGYKTAANAAATNNGTLTNLKTNWTAVGTTDAVIATNAAATHSAGDVIDLTFGASASPSQAADTYSDVITLTATATTN